MPCRSPGSAGRRRACAIAAALERPGRRPQTTFAGEDLHSDLPAKAAALLHALVQSHPFVDGNKRIGAHAMILFLVVNGCTSGVHRRRSSRRWRWPWPGRFCRTKRSRIWLRQRSRQGGGAPFGRPEWEAGDSFLIRLGEGGRLNGPCLQLLPWQLSPVSPTSSTGLDAESVRNYCKHMASVELKVARIGNSRG